MQYRREESIVRVIDHISGAGVVCVWEGSGMVCGGVILSAVGCCLWLTIAGGVSSPPSYSYTRKGHHYSVVADVVLTSTSSSEPVPSSRENWGEWLSPSIAGGEVGEEDVSCVLSSGSLTKRPLLHSGISSSCASVSGGMGLRLTTPMLV